MSDSDTVHADAIPDEDSFFQEFMKEIRLVKRLKYLLFLVCGIALGAMGEEVMDWVNHVILHGIYP